MLKVKNSNSLKCPCVTSILNLTLSNPEAEKIIEEENNTYLFTSTKLDTDIIFETNPKVTVTSTSILLKDITFVDNVLSITAVLTLVNLII